jgi:hypothetical protein
MTFETSETISIEAAIRWILEFAVNVNAAVILMSSYLISNPSQLLPIERSKNNCISGACWLEPPPQALCVNFGSFDHRHTPNFASRLI